MIHTQSAHSTTHHHVDEVILVDLVLVDVGIPSTYHHVNGVILENPIRVDINI